MEDACTLPTVCTWERSTLCTLAPAPRPPHSLQDRGFGKAWLVCGPPRGSGTQQPLVPEVIASRVIKGGQAQDSSLSLHTTMACVSTTQPCSLDFPAREQSADEVKQITQAQNYNLSGPAATKYQVAFREQRQERPEQRPEH